MEHVLETIEPDFGPVNVPVFRGPLTEEWNSFYATSRVDRSVVVQEFYDSEPARARVVWSESCVERAQRATRGATVWITGLSASGKSTIASELERLLVAAGRPAYRLDGDNLRHGLNSDLDFTQKGRAENVRRVGAVAELMADAGLVTIACLISPYRCDRDAVRRSHHAAGLPFYEIFVDTPITECEKRDPKGMYAKARAGEITGFTGIDDPYETPDHPDLVLRPADGDRATQARKIMELLSA